MTVIRGENGKAAGGSHGGDSDIGEAWIVCASAIKNGARVAGLLDTEVQDAPGIVLETGEPAA